MKKMIKLKTIGEVEKKQVGSMFSFAKINIKSKFKNTEVKNKMKQIL